MPKEGFLDYQYQSGGGGLARGAQEMESNTVCCVKITFMQFIALFIPSASALSNCDFCQSEMIESLLIIAIHFGADNNSSLC